MNTVCLSCKAQPRLYTPQFFTKSRSTQNSRPGFRSSLRSALTLNQCFCCPWKAAIQRPLPTERDIRPALTPDVPADRRQTDVVGTAEYTRTGRSEHADGRSLLSQHSSHTPAIAGRRNPAQNTPPLHDSLCGISPRMIPVQTHTSSLCGLCSPSCFHS